jgi:sporulation protein YlmC with PRC-barrel domain
MMRVSHLEGVRVITEAGERLGRIWELQSPGNRKDEPRRERRPIEQLLCGRLGLLERLGWRERSAVVVPWRKVLRWEADALVVEGGAEDYERITP